MMTWDYIAGFFDGEGTICTKSRACRGIGFTVQISQVNSDVLYQISDFLTARRAKNSVRRYHYTNKKFGWKQPQHRLVLTNRGSVEIFLKGLQGRLVVKKQFCEDALRFMRMYPSLRDANRPVGPRRKNNKFLSPYAEKLKYGKRREV
jgi:hypothetical protein